MKLVNLTPDTINIHSNGQVLEVEPSGEVARVIVLNDKLNDITVDGFKIQINSAMYGWLVNLGPVQPETIYIVSTMVQQRCNELKLGRDDLYSPGELARNEQGVVVGCYGLSKIY